MYGIWAGLGKYQREAGLASPGISFSDYVMYAPLLWEALRSPKLPRHGLFPRLAALSPEVGGQAPSANDSNSSVATPYSSSANLARLAHIAPLPDQTTSALTHV